MVRPTVLCGALLAAVVTASSPATAASVIDTVEHFFGATAVHAITGQGYLTAGVSRDGDLTVLSWPNPSYSDQLGILTSNALDARDRPHFGADEGAGSFLGLIVENGGNTTEVTWLRDAETWTASQSYGPTDGANIQTAFHSDRWGLDVVVTDAVAPPPSSGGPPAHDVLVRDVRVSLGAGSTVTGVTLLAYANLSPMPPGARLSELPVSDWAADGRNDFAAVWDAAADAVVQFHPSDQRIYNDIADFLLPPAADYGPIGEALQGDSITDDALASLAANLDTDYASGAYLAVTTWPPPDEHQVGFDATPFCDRLDELIDNVEAVPDEFPGVPLPLSQDLLDQVRCDRATLPTPEHEGWHLAAEDALSDAADGELSGAGLAAGEVNLALRTPLTFESDENGRQRAEGALIIGAGPDAATALAAVASVTRPQDVLDAAEADLTAWLAQRRVPHSESPLVVQVARRALINVRVGTVAENGAIVASISRQPPYGLDWPRDGAFFDVLLDVSGQSDLVDRRVALSGQWQRAEATPPAPIIDQPPPVDPDTGSHASYPAGGWEMNYYSDGLPGGTDRFEIDNTAFAVWAMVAHVGWVDAADRTAYLTARWPNIEAGASLLARWRDPDTGLQAPAQEDDNAAYTQTLHGAVTTYGALDIAARAARMLGQDDDAAAWEARALELRDAILAHLYDDDARRFISMGGVDNPGSAPTGPTAWLAWPMHVFDWSDARLDTQLRADLDAITPIVALETEGGAYVMKNTLSLALVLGDDAEVRPRVEQMLEDLAGQSTDGTHHFGEVEIVVQGDDGQPHADQRVATPHLWEGTLFYLTAMALDDPQALLAYDAVLPPSRVPAAAPPDWAPTEGDADQAGDAPVEPEADAGGDAGPSRVGGGGGCDCSAAGGGAESMPCLGALAVMLAGAASRRRRVRARRSR